MSDPHEDESSNDEAVVQTLVRSGVLRIFRPGTKWLSTGANGGYSTGPVAYNITVPSGWDRKDLDRYTRSRLREAGFESRGPALLTGVSMEHARIARAGPAAVVATAGVSNPAVFENGSVNTERSRSEEPSTGTVNIIVCVERNLSAGAHANLVAVAAEAKAAALLAETGFPGTTTDAIIVGCDPDAATAEFSGSATTVGAAVRRCVYHAVMASLHSRYAETDLPESVDAAEYGVVTDQKPAVTKPLAQKDQAD